MTMLFYWCNECQSRRQCRRNDPHDETYTCDECGEIILCDECGSVWTDDHDEEDA